jgi:hypothetical protein
MENEVVWHMLLDCMMVVKMEAWDSYHDSRILGLANWKLLLRSMNLGQVSSSREAVSGNRFLALEQWERRVDSWRSASERWLEEG